MINTTPLTKEQKLNYILAHNDDCQGGPSSFGWAIVQHIDSEHCRVVAALGALGSQVFLAAYSRLTVWKHGKEGEPQEDVKIEPKILEKVNALRREIKEGKTIISGNRFCAS